MSNDYEQRQAARKERFEELAAKARRESEATYSNARRMGSVIPFGQPILVGHHSEGRDRRYRARIGRAYDKGAELSSKASYYEGRAESVGKGGISSDDPQAIEKLQAELAKLEKMQDTMKRANTCVRKDDRAGLTALGFSESRINQLFTPDFCGRLGFPDYALTNNNGNMRRIRLRIEQLQRRPTESTENQIHLVDESPTRSNEPVGESPQGQNNTALVTVREDAVENRVMLIFPGKPPEAVRAILKRSGFKWSPTRGAWVRFLNDAGRAAAQYVVSKITESK